MRLGIYIDIRPSAAMKDVIVKIMVEVITILGIVTKEVGQGRISMSFWVDFYIPKIDLRRSERYLKRLVGRKDIENALQRLDKLTAEAVRLAEQDVLAISHHDGKLQEWVDRIERRAQVLDGPARVKDANYVVKGVGHIVKDVNQG